MKNDMLLLMISAANSPDSKVCEALSSLVNLRYPEEEKRKVKKPTQKVQFLAIIAQPIE